MSLSIALYVSAFLLAAQSSGFAQEAKPQEPASERQQNTSVSSSSSGAGTPEDRTSFHRFSYGAQIRWWTAQPFRGKGIEVGNSSANTSDAYNTTSSSGRYAFGPRVDFNITSHWSLSGEAFFEHFQYTKITQEYTGTPTDGTLNQTLTEHTMAGYWDFPILARYQLTPKPVENSTSTTGSSPHFSFIGKIPTHAFFEAGVAVRHLMTVRTGNDTLNSDNSTAYNETPTSPKHSTVEGLVVGLGLRFRDDLGTEVMPSIRYVLWSGPIFESQSTLSRTRQIEVGLSFVF